MFVQGASDFRYPTQKYSPPLRLPVCKQPRGYDKLVKR